MPAFYIPETDDSAFAWEWYANAVGVPLDRAEPLYSIRYEHDGDRCTVTVGEPRQKYPRETGPRGGYRRNAGHRGWASPTGTVVTTIMRTPTD
jgi:hypothetical protein